MSAARKPERPWFAPVAALAVVILGSVIALVFFGPQARGILSTVGASIGSPYQGAGGGSDGSATGGDTTGDDSSGGSAGSGDGGVVTAAPRDELLIIKTASLTLEVVGIDAALRAATEAIAAFGGHASGSERSGAGQDAQATATFRVPAARFDEAMNAVRGLARQVVAERSTTDEVTGQVVDLAARIRNLDATERALQSIMDRATLIEDVLAVQAELTTVRGSIEQLAAQKAHLEEQAAYSAISVTFVLQPAPVLVEQQDRFNPAREVDAASASLVGVLQGIATAGIWFGIVWLPILLALGFVAAVIGLAAGRLRRAADRGRGGPPSRIHV